MLPPEYCHSRSEASHGAERALQCYLVTVKSALTVVAYCCVSFLRCCVYAVVLKVEDFIACGRDCKPVENAETALLQRLRSS